MILVLRMSILIDLGICKAYYTKVEVANLIPSWYGIAGWNDLFLGVKTPYAPNINWLYK